MTAAGSEGGDEVGDAPGACRPLEAVTLACVSLQKTGSTALVLALRRAGFNEALHLHFLGPKAHASGASQPEGSPDISSRVADPQHAFVLVTAVRDPIARIVSHAFHNARPGDTITNESVVAWIDRRRHGEASLAWFEDTYEAPFGFDFRRHPFDPARRSLRFASPRLKLLILRVEDPAAGKECELGWLVDRGRVAISWANDSQSRFGERYRDFVESFIAPPHWLERFYETDLMRHFYSEEERAGFRAKWGGGRVA